MVGKLLLLAGIRLRFVRTGNQVVEVRVTFDRETCAVCPLRERCTWVTRTGRVLHLHSQVQQEALERRRVEQQTTATAINLVRLLVWLTSPPDASAAMRHPSAFAELQAT